MRGEQHTAQEQPPAVDSKQHGAQDAATRTGIDPEKLLALAKERHHDGGVTLGWPTVLRIVEGLRERYDLAAQLEGARQEATFHAQEARTQRATVREIYSLVSGGRGEPGDWHGAGPVRELVSERDGLQRLADGRAEQRDALATFVNEAIDAAFAGCGLDGAWIQERAEELGLLTAEAYDPEIHHTDCELMEPGDTIYVRQPWMGTKGGDDAE